MLYPGPLQVILKLLLLLFIIIVTIIIIIIIIVITIIGILAPGPWILKVPGSYIYMSRGCPVPNGYTPSHMGEGGAVVSYGLGVEMVCNSIETLAFHLPPPPL